MAQAAVFSAYLVFWGALGVHPVDYGNWVMASILPLTLVGALLAGRRTLPLSTASSVLVVAFLCLHTIGAHYTYAQVPMGAWLMRAGLPLLCYLTFMTQLGLAGAWEIIEAAVAQLVRPDLGLAFVGAQGDPWDAQHDMLAATCGTLAALLLVLGARALSRAPDRSGAYKGAR